MVNTHIFCYNMTVFPIYFEGAITIRSLKIFIILLLTMSLMFVLFACDAEQQAPYESDTENAYDYDGSAADDDDEDVENVNETEEPDDNADNYVGAYEGDTVYDDFWAFERFADIRGPSFETSLPHGHIAVGLIEYINDNFPGRSPFTYLEKETAAWIIEELLAAGHDWENIEVQEFDTYDLIGISGLVDLNWRTVVSEFILGEGRDYQIRQDRGSQNVILTLQGQSERKIIVGAHYDSVPYPGASDNASGMALLLESAQRMLYIDHYHTIVYVFFGAEEVGLWGAYYYYESLTPQEYDNIVMMINADVLIEGPYIIYGTAGEWALDDDALEVFATRIAETIIAEHVEASGEEWDDDVLDTWAGGMVQHFAGNPAFAAIQGAALGLLEVEANETSRQVDALATALSEANEFELIAVPEGIAFSSDNLVFFKSHTVVNLIGLERIENVDGERIPMGMQVNPEFTSTILHSPYDEFNRIEYLWPGMMLANMTAFGLFLEAILTTEFN